MSSQHNWRDQSVFHKPAYRFDIAQTTPSLFINQATTCRWSLEEDLRNYERCGAGGIGIWRQKVTAENEETAAALIVDSGIEVSSVGWVSGFTGTMGYRLAEFFDDALDALRLAGQLDADCVLATTGRRGAHIRSHSRRLLVAGLREMGDLAAEYGVPVALHPMCDEMSRELSFMGSLREAVDVLDEVDHPFVKLVFSSYHSWQEPDLQSLIPQILPFVALVQLSDWNNPRGIFDRYCLGDGEIPLRLIVQEFLRQGYTGRFELDVWSERLWKARIEYAQVLEQQVEYFDRQIARPVRAPYVRRNA